MQVFRGILHGRERQSSLRDGLGEAEGQMGDKWWLRGLEEDGSKSLFRDSYLHYFILSRRQHMRKPLYQEMVCSVNCFVSLG